MWPVDFPNAYKLISLNASSSIAPHICFLNPTGRSPYRDKASVQPFVSRRALGNWGRVATFLQFAARGLSLPTLGAFVDDVYFAESAKAANSGFRAFKQLGSILGFNTSTKKDQPPETQMVLLRADVSLRDERAQATALTDRATKLMGHIALALQTNCLAPAAARKLRG